MTLDKFISIEKEVVTLVENTLNEIKNKSFQDYILLLIRADYDERIARCKSLGLSPYIIENREDDYKDFNRQGFMLEYIQRHKSLNTNSQSINTYEYSEYDLNIQMMIYTHIWESHLFLKLLERISNLLAGKGYKWQSQLYKCKQKSNFISHHIINPIKDLNHNFHKILTKTYNNHLRNSFSHSDYYINIDKETIHFYDQGKKYNISFKEWDNIFFTALLLSYYLPVNLKTLKNDFIRTHGKNPIKLERPSFSCPSQKQIFYIVPAYNKLNPQTVEFKFYQ